MHLDRIWCYYHFDQQRNHHSIRSSPDIPLRWLDHMRCLSIDCCCCIHCSAWYIVHWKSTFIPPPESRVILINIDHRRYIHSIYSGIQRNGSVICLVVWWRVPIPTSSFIHLWSRSGDRFPWCLAHHFHCSIFHQPGCFELGYVLSHSSIN